MSTENNDNKKKDFQMMIEKSYDILTNYEKKNNEFYNSFREVDKKIVEKETAFANAKTDLKEFIDQFLEDYKTYLTKVSTVFKNELNQANEEFKKKMIDTAEKVEAQKADIRELKKYLFFSIAVNGVLAVIVSIAIIKIF